MPRKTRSNGGRDTAEIRAGRLGTVLKVTDAKNTESRQYLLEDLVEWADENLTWPVDDIFARVMRATFVEALRTCRAAAMLTREGFSREALKLGRSAFESVIVSYWAIHGAESEAWVIDRMRDHHRYNAALLLERLEEHNWPIPELDADAVPNIDADRDRLTALFGRHGEVSWWVRDIEEKPGGGWKVTRTRRLGGLVDELVTNPELEGVLWDLRAPENGEEGEPKTVAPIKTMEVVPQRLNNQFLHHNPTGLASFVSVVDDEIVYEQGPSDEWLPQAQLFLYMCLSTQTQLMVTQYQPDLATEFDARFRPLFHRAYMRLEPHQLAWAENNRNEPCPCGSGLKSKRCHAA